MAVPGISQWRRRLSYVLRKAWRSVLVVNATPHRIALGFAIGVLIDWLPIVGVQMLVSVVVCRLFKASVVASIPPIWVSNPLTVVPMYYGLNRLGALLAGQALTLDEMRAVVQRLSELGLGDAHHLLVTTLAAPFIAMVIGGFIVGTVAAVPSYFIVRAAVTRFQARRRAKILRLRGGSLAEDDVTSSARE